MSRHNPDEGGMIIAALGCTFFAAIGLIGAAVVLWNAAKKLFYE